MRITAIRSHIVSLGFRNGIFTEIETDVGIVGYSETVLKRLSRTIATGITELGHTLIGQDPRRVEDHYEKLYRDSFWVGGPMHASIISALEIALWDILGKELGLPLYRLFGGPTRDRVLLYAHCQSGDSPALFASNARARQREGYRAIKTTLPRFYGAGQGTGAAYSGTRGQIDRSLKETEFLSPGTLAEIAQYFAAARDAVGAEMGLALDCHGRLSPANAARLAEALAPYQLLFLEEPVPPEDVGALAWVTARSPLPIAAGERSATIYDAAHLMEQRAVSIYQPDVVNCGGLSQARKMAAIAEAHYVSVAPHNPNGAMCSAASLQLAASIPNFYMLETIGSEEDAARFGEIVDQPLVIEDGHWLLPDAPGLGMNLRRSALKKYPGETFTGYR